MKIFPNSGMTKFREIVVGDHINVTRTCSARMISTSDNKTAKQQKLLNFRHFGDPEIFSKPLIVLMGPWSGGKSTMINYILGNEYNAKAFKTGAEPSEGMIFHEKNFFLISRKNNHIK